MLRRTSMLHFSKAGLARSITSSRCKCAEICHQGDGRKKGGGNPEFPPRLRMERLEVTGWAEECGEKTQQPVKTNLRSIWTEKMFADAPTFPCFALSADPPTNAQNTCKDFWKPYTGKTLFNLLGHHKEFPFSRQEFLARPRLGSRGATGKPGGRMLEVFKEGSYTNQMEHNGPPPTPYRAHCWPLCMDMYVQKEHFEDQEVFLCRSSHCQDFPPPHRSPSSPCDL